MNGQKPATHRKILLKYCKKYSLKVTFTYHKLGASFVMRTADTFFSVFCNFLLLRSLVFRLSFRHIVLCLFCPACFFQFLYYTMDVKDAELFTNHILHVIHVIKRDKSLNFISLHDCCNLEDVNILNNIEMRREELKLIERK